VARPLILAERGPLLAALLLTLLLHALALALLQRALQQPSLLRAMAPPLYTRTISPEAFAPVTGPAPVVAVDTKPNRPTVVVRRARPTGKKRAQPASVPASAPEVTETPEAPGSAALAETPLPVAEPPFERGQAAQDADMSVEVTAAASASEPVADPLAEPATAASAPEPAFLSSWPADTRLTYKLGGNYRGELHGSARVLWQRQGTRYQAVVEMSAGLLASLTFSSQGEITVGGLRPEVYQEDNRRRRRGVLLGDEDVRLHNGTRVARPEGVQDAASQFVELGHRFATGQTELAAGTQIRLALARPGGVDDWVYDVTGEEIIYLPRLGPVTAWHLKPRRLDRPRGPLTAEMWFAPALQYLPVRILITQDADTYLDLLVQTIEQK
jgi:hypothetical protein